jgi:integrase
MTDMPRPRPPHLHREINRHGTPVWFVRVGHGPRTRIRSEFGTPEFDAEYQAALAGMPARKSKDNAAGTLAWLVERYRETTAWTSLALETRQRRENILLTMLDSAGHQPFTRITKAAIVAGRERRKPFQAKHFMDTVRGLFRWAVDAGLAKVDPTAGVAYPKLPDSDGFPPWREDDVALYEKRWPIGTRERVWLDVLLYTGLRRGDAVRLGKQHVRNSVATIKTEKTGTEVTLPILPVLEQTLAAGPCGDLAFIVSAAGKPFQKHSFGNAFAAAARKAGIKGKSAHGLRKLGATRAANAGATTAQLKAIFGWTSDRMPSLYTRAADRRRLAIEGMAKLANGS